MKIKDRIISAIKGFMAGGPRSVFFNMTSLSSRLRARSVETDPAGNYAGWVYAALSKIAKRMAAINLHLYQMKANGDIVEVSDTHKLMSLIYRANPIQSKFQFFFTLSIYKGIWGSAPVYKERLGNNGQIINLWPLRPDLLRATVNPDTGAIVKYTYTVGGGVQELNPEDVILNNEPSPIDLRTGNSPLNAAALEIDADTAAAIFNRALIENWGEPGGILTTEQKINDEEFDRLRKTWDARQHGPTGAGRTSLLEKGLKYEPIGRSPKDLDLVESRKFHRNAITSILGVPMGLMTSEDVNLANAEVAERVFAQDTIDPEMNLLISSFNEFLVPEFGADLYLDYDSPVKDDIDRKVKVSDASREIATINERRELFNYEPIEGGDAIFLPIGMMPQVGEGATPTTIPVSSELGAQHGANKGLPYGYVKIDVTRKENAKMRKIRSYISRRLEKKKAIESAGVRGATKAISEILSRKDEGGAEIKVIKLKARFADSKKKDDDEPEPQIDPRIKADRIEYLRQLPLQQKKSIKLFKNYFRNQEKEVLANLDSEGAPKSAAKSLDKWINKIIFDQAKQNQILLSIAGDMYKENILIGAAAIAKLIGVSPSEILLSPFVSTFIDRESFKLLTANDTTRDNLRETLKAGIEAGEDLGQLRGRIEDVYDEAQGFRTETIARTEVGSAQNFGRTEEMKAQHAARKKWIATFSNTREAHAQADGQVVPVDEAFNVGGESLHYPGDPSGSAANVINCQCSAVPTLDDENS